MTLNFSEASYLSQVRRLRALAESAVAQYPIGAQKIHFIHHGENTTFRVECKGGKSYLLRIHRNDYHTKPAIEEELSWLAHLSKQKMSVPKPVESERGRLVETIFHPGLPEQRNCCLFEWIDGRFLRHSISPRHLYQVGGIIADLQTHGSGRAVVHRRYWTSAGLVGGEPKFGSIDSLSGVRARQQRIISDARVAVFKTLRRFEKKFPDRMGLIHADLHFGNVLSTGEGLGAIDFDDCGFGFHAYDLVIPLLSVESILIDKKPSRLPEYREALLSGYGSKRSWDANDQMIFGYLCTARKLTMLGWLNSRADNPRLRKHMKGAVQRALLHMKTNYNWD